MSSETDIVVENLSKLYRLGAAEARSDTLIGAMSSLIKAPVRNFRKLRSLDTRKAQAQGDSDDLLWALREVSFEVKRGEVLGVIGRNGAGKSTLLKILSRITEPTSGRVRLRGRVASLLEVGTGFHPELTGRENVYMNGTILGMTKREIDRKFDEIVDFSGVERFLDTPVKRYSSGMKVRLAFAVAAHLEPEILIVDEVLSVGDFEFQRKCLGKMQEITEGASQRTILFVSHNMNAMARLCGRIIMLKQGRLMLDGAPEEVIQQYLGETQTESACDMCFPNDEDRPVQFTRVSVLDDSGQLNINHSCDDPITIRLECLVRRPVAGTYLGVLVLNSEGTRVLFSDSRDAISDLSSRLEAGMHEFRVVIPQRLLAPGDYSINLGLASAISGSIDSRLGSVAFSLSDLSSQRESRPGVLSVRLPWQHREVEASELQLRSI